MKLKYALITIIIAHSTAFSNPPPWHQNLAYYVSSAYGSESITQQLINLYKPHMPALDLNTLRGETNRLFETRQVNINDFDPLTGFTPFQTAIANPDIPYQIIFELVQNGATSFQDTTFNQSVLSLAAQYDREPEAFNILIKSGADPMHVERIMTYFTDAAVGCTPLNYLLRNAKNHLMQNNLEKYQRTSTSIRVLMEALRFQITTQSNSTYVQLSLLASGDYGPNSPCTTLSWIAYIGDVPLMKDFLGRFQDLVKPFINQEVHGKTAYDWAEGNPEMLMFLRVYNGQKFVNL